MRMRSSSWLLPSFFLSLSFPYSADLSNVWFSKSSQFLLLDEKNTKKGEREKLAASMHTNWLLRLRGRQLQLSQQGIIGSDTREVEIKQVRGKEAFISFKLSHYWLGGKRVFLLRVSSSFSPHSLPFLGISLSSSGSGSSSRIRYDKTMETNSIEDYYYYYSACTESSGICFRYMKVNGSCHFSEYVFFYQHNNLGMYVCRRQSVNRRLNNHCFLPPIGLLAY